ncbi:MAG: acetylesterase [Planctomycetia bacterium]|nr:acetylesterase [Planctomycetia bacterium]
MLSEYNRSSGVRTWQYAYVNILLAEYVIATGDRSFVEKGLERITRMIVDGQSVVGSWGHGFIGGPHNRLEGYGMMNAPGIPLTYSLALAQRAKINVPGMGKALRKSLALIRFYVDKGSIPYGDHNPWIETHCDNGKNEMAAVLFNLESDAEATEFFSHMATASHGAERDEGHTGNFFNMTWALLGVARSGKHATGAWLEEFGWHYDLARRWDGTFLYQGAPTPKPESYHQWDSTGAYLLAYCMPLKKTYLTGRRKSPAPQIDRSTAESLVKDGQGWTNNDRNSFYQAMDTTTLIQRLKSWSPVVRERAAMELGRRNEPAIVPSLIQLLSSRDLDGQIGACQALKFQRGRAEPAIAALRKAFRSSDLWLRVMSAEALAAIGEPARKVVPELLSRLSLKASSKDPRNMEQRYLTIALFSQRNGLIGKSLESVDSKMLVKAVRASLLNQDGRARGAIATVYKNLSFKQLKPLLPAILEAITVRAPSGIMFAHEIRMAGLELFATHRISEGIELLADYALDMKPHASEHRIIKVMEMLEKYGAHAQRVIPQLEEHAQFFDEGQPDFPLTLSQGKARVVRESIGRIQASTARPKLMSLKKIR